MGFWELVFSLVLVPAGYSAGTVAVARGKNTETSIGDALIVAILWLLIFGVNAILLLEMRILFIFGAATLVGLSFGALRRKSQSDVAMGETNETQAGVWRQIKGNWSQFATRLGNFQGRLLLILFYFVIVLPFGLLVRLFRDPLRKKTGSDTTFWTEKL